MSVCVCVSICMRVYLVRLELVARFASMLRFGSVLLTLSEILRFCFVQLDLLLRLAQIEMSGDRYAVRIEHAAHIEACGKHACVSNILIN